MKHIYLFLGANKFKVEEKIKQIISEKNVDDLSLVKYDCEETTIDEIINDCETLPFLSDQKIIIMNNPIFLSSQKSKLEHNVDRFINYIDHPHEMTLLMINASEIKLDKKKKVNKLLLKNAQIFQYDKMSEEEARSLVSAYFTHLKVDISKEAINELIIRTECQALKLHSELNKLSFYLDDKDITLDDIKVLVCEPIENNIFNLTNQIIEHKIEASIKTYHQLLMNNEEPIVFSSILGKNFHHLYVIKQYQKKGYSEYDLKKILKMHPYQLKKLYHIAKKTEEEDITANIQALHEYDVNVKSGKVDKYLGFELLIMNM